MKYKKYLIAFLSLSALLTATAAFANLNFGATTIESTGALNLNPTGQPVMVNGDLTVTGSCTGCGGGSVGGADQSIQYNNNGVLAGTTSNDWARGAVWDQTANDGAGALYLEVVSNRQGDSYFMSIYGEAKRPISLSVGSTSHGQFNYGVYVGNYIAADTPNGNVIASPFVASALYVENGFTPSAGSIHATLMTEGVGTLLTNDYFLFHNAVNAVYAVRTEDGATEYYNPGFAKYTPGDANYERGILQWNNDSLEFGTEKGGTGAVQKLVLKASQIDVPSAPLYIDTIGGYSSSTLNIDGDLLSYGTISGQTIAINTAGGHFRTVAANNDVDGLITISASTNSSHVFTTAYSSAPACTLTPTSDPNATGRYWVTTSTTAVTANVSTSGTISFYYHCVGNPN